MRMSEFGCLLQCSELDASSIKCTILSSKSEINVTAWITLCHSLWWRHIWKQCVTPCHDNISQDMKRHLKTLCHYLKTVPPIAMKRHLKTLSLSQDSVTHVTRQCQYSITKIPINAYFHPGSFLTQLLKLQNAWQNYYIQYWHFN
jgi:hypothetical protein